MSNARPGVWFFRGSADFRGSVFLGTIFLNRVNSGRKFSVGGKGRMMLEWRVYEREMPPFLLGDLTSVLGYIGPSASPFCVTVGTINPDRSSLSDTGQSVVMLSSNPRKHYYHFYASLWYDPTRVWTTGLPRSLRETFLRALYRLSYSDRLWGPWVKAFSSYWSKIVFHIKVTLTLTFDPLTSKSIGFICWSWLISLPNMRSLGQSVLKLLIGNSFSCKGHTDLDLWPTDLKINMVHLLVMTNTPTKYEVPGSKRSQVIDRKPFFM